MYSFKSRVRYSEVDKNKHLDLFSIINYFQDCSTFQSEDIGKGLDYLEQANRLWLMNAWQINVNRFPKLGEEIVISTWPYDFQSMYGYRNFLITDSMGQVVAAANSIWVYMNTKENRPVRVTDEAVKYYQLEEKYHMEYAPRKIEIPKNLSALESFSVVRSNIDTNNHVNNGQYIRMAEECLPEDFLIRQMRAEYRKSAVLGDTIIPMVNFENNVFTVVLTDTDGKPYTVIEFQQ
jgi:acyl-ACP thioesterase